MILIYHQKPKFSNKVDKDTTKTLITLILSALKMSLMKFIIWFVNYSSRELCTYNFKMQ